MVHWRVLVHFGPSYRPLPSPSCFWFPTHRFFPQFFFSLPFSNVCFFPSFFVVSFFVFCFFVFSFFSFFFFRRRVCGISRGSGRWWGHVSRSHLRSQSRSPDLVNMFCRHLVTLFPTYLVIALLRLLWNEGSEFVGNRV